MSTASQDLVHTKVLQIPTVDHTRIYSPTERLELALSHYHAKLQQYQHNPISNKRPIVLRIAQAYQVSETTLRRRIKNPMQTAQLAAEGHSNQALTGAEEMIAYGFWMTLTFQLTGTLFIHSPIPCYTAECLIVSWAIAG